MKRRTGFYSTILTSVVCMLVYSSSGSAAVRILGSGGNTVVGAGNTSVDTGAKVANPGTSAVSQSTRGSSLRFSNATQTAAAITSTTATQSYSGLSGAAANGAAAVSSTDTPTARLSIGKYLNLSHSAKAVPSGGQQSSGGASNADLDALQAQIDRLQTSVDGLKTDKQNALIVGSGEYIDISGPDDNVISIDIDALKSDLQNALGTSRDILTEIDEDYKVWWCYANDAGNGCVNTKQLVVDLGTVLKEYDLANENVSLSQALAGKQGTLTTTDAGYISIDQESGRIDVKFAKLKADLGISDAKQSEIRYTEDGKLQWRYMDEFETDPNTGQQVKKWTTADINSLIQQSLNNYALSSELTNYVLKSELSGLQGNLTASENGYLQIVDNQIGVKFNDLKNALNIPTEREVEIDFSDDGKIKWRYVGADAWHQTTKKVSDFVDLSNYVLHSELGGLQGALTASENGYLQINNNEIGIKFNELKTALNIPAAQQDIEMEITSGGQLRWRYLNQFEEDGTTKKWTVVSENINDLINNKLVDYQKTLSADPNGYLQIDNNVIGIKFNELKTALNIPAAQEKIEMEITDAGQLRWRYLDEFEQDGTTKKWTAVSVNIGDLIDGKLVPVNNALATKQLKLSEANNGFIAITPVDGQNIETIGIKFNELKEALGIDTAHTSEIRVDNGVLQWRYMDEFQDEPDPETGEPVKKWTDVYDLKSRLDDYVLKSDFNRVVEQINTELAGKQIKLTPAEEGYIILNQETGVIAVDMAGLRSYLSIEGDNARTSELRVFDGKLQWRYLDEYEIDEQDNKVQIWHTLDLTAVELPLYVKKGYLTDNYYNKIYIDNLARTIENNINISLASLWPEDNGLYLISISGEAGENKSWKKVQIVDGDGVLH